MGLKQDLQNVRCTSEDLDNYTAVHDFYSLYKLMDAANLKQIVTYLRLEMEGRRRPSYINRIYGRYRKMLPQRDAETIQNWVPSDGKS